MARVMESVKNDSKERMKNIKNSKKSKKKFSTLTKAEKDALFVQVLQNNGFDID